MGVKKLFFVSLYFLISLVALNTAGGPKSSQAKLHTFGTFSFSPSKLFKGEVKQNVEKLFEVDSDLLKRQDEFAVVNGKLEETRQILLYKKALFEKENEGGTRSQEYITKLKAAYEKWEKLDKTLKHWIRVEESIPTRTWTNLENGPEVLSKVQQSKSQVKAQMREVESEHNVYASRKNQLEKGGETFKQTHDEVKQETLSKLQSAIEDITAEKNNLLEQLKSIEKSKQNQMGIAAQSWIEEKGYMDDLERNTNTFAPKEATGKLSGHLDAAKLKEELNEKFNNALESLVTQYEEQINRKEEEQGDSNDAKTRNEIVQDRIQFNRQRNYLYDTRYSLVNPKLSENPLQKENSVIDLINNILNHEDLTRRFRKKLLSKAKLLKDNIANSPACRFQKDAKTGGKFSTRMAISANRFKSEVSQIMEQAAASTPVERDLVLKQVKKETERHQRKFQKMMDYFTRIEQCAQTLRKIENAVTNVEQLTKKLK